MSSIFVASASRVLSFVFCYLCNSICGNSWFLALKSVTDGNLQKFAITLAAVPLDLIVIYLFMAQLKEDIRNATLTNQICLPVITFNEMAASEGPCTQKYASDC